MTPVVCVCQHVPEEVVEQACQRGARCLDDVRDMTGACTGCGDCAPDIEDILADHLERDHLNDTGSTSALLAKRLIRCFARETVGFPPVMS